MLNITQGGNVFYVTGFISDDADFKALLAARPPVIVNLKGVSGINSSGARSFMEFTGSWGGRPHQYVECPIVMVDAFLMLPALLGPEENTAHIRSLYAPYECISCQDGVALLVSDHEIKLVDGEILLPPKSCPSCAKALVPEDRVVEFAALFEQGALKK